MEQVGKREHKVGVVQQELGEHGARRASVFGRVRRMREITFFGG